MEYILVYKNRKTVAIHIQKNGEVEVRAPRHTPVPLIEEFLNEKREWILKTQKRITEQKENHNKLMDANEVLFLGSLYSISLGEENNVIKFCKNRINLPDIDFEEKKRLLIRFYKKEAVRYLKERLELYSGLANIPYKQIKINSATTRWGSCSSQNGINFSYRIMFLPSVLIDYIVVHELSHIIEHNHSEAFWRVLESLMPDYKQRQHQLKEFTKTMFPYVF
ncbi:MAG: hypothetical protein BGN88_06325 [Clostridiales bacterium 43-6]|nr:MAG: hypothetical protein BGN88_06325 [Clostridiales bacterium 43-6]